MVMVELMPHQEEAVENLANGKILWGGVGSGKSIAVLAYYMKKEAPKDIYVITTAKKRDTLEWMGDAAKFGIGITPETSLAGVLHIDSWNNIDKYTEIEDAFFIFDEQRVVGAGTWVKAFQKIAKNNNWVLLTATPGDTWLDYVAVFVANNFFRNPTEFKREHVIYSPFSRYPKIDRYVNVAALERYRSAILVEMPYLRHTTRIVEEVRLDYDHEVMRRAMIDRWHPFEDRPIKDVGELFLVMRRIVNGDPSRQAMVLELLEQHPKLIVFYNFNYELAALRELGSLGIPIAEWNGHRKQPIPDTDTWLYLVQYTSGSEGWNCIETDAMVFYSLTYSYKNLEQSMGRIDRLNTPFTDLYYYLFMSNSTIDNAIRKSQTEKRIFNERVWASEIFDTDGVFDNPWYKNYKL